MTGLYEATVDDIIRVFMQIANYRLRLKGGSLGKGHDHMSLELKAIAHIGDPTLLVEAMSSTPRADDLNIGKNVLEGCELFGSTKRKLDWPLRLSMIFIV